MRKELEIKRIKGTVFYLKNVNKFFKRYLTISIFIISVVDSSEFLI